MAENRHPLAVLIGRRLRHARQVTGLSQADTAAALRINTDAYRSYELGWRMLPMEVLIRLPDAFQRSLHYFLGLPDPEGLQDDERHLVRLYRAIQAPRIRAFLLEMILHQLEVDKQLQAQGAHSAPAPRAVDAGSTPGPQDE